MGHLTSLWTTVQGRRLYARVSTDPVPPGRLPVVLVHGLVVSSLYLAPTAARLAPDYRVYAPDLPGFGESDKPPEVLTVPGLTEALAAWMDAVGLARAALLGNSLGCQIIAEFGVRYPERLDRAIFTGPTMDRRGRTALEQIKRLAIDGPREPPHLGPVMLRDYWVAGPRRAIRTLQYALADHIEEKLPQVQAPILVVRGGRDPVVPQRWAEEVTNLLPRGRLVAVPGAGHYVTYDAPLELVRVVRPFLEEATAGRPESPAL